MQHDDSLWLYLTCALIVTLIGALYLFFQLSRSRRDVFELQKDLSISEQNLAQIGQKYEQLGAEKQRIEQIAVLQQTRADNIEIRLNERDSHIVNLQQQLNDAAKQENEMESYINALKERVGSAEAKSDALNEQLQSSQLHLVNKERETQQLNGQLNQVSQELAELRTSLHEKQANFEQQQRNFAEVKQQMNVEFQHLAQQILDEKSKHFAEANQNSLNLLLTPFKEQIEGFQKRVNEIHTESVRGNTNLEAEIKKVLNIGMTMSQDAQNLTSALKGDNKLAGNWGEMQLERALQNAGLLAGEHYSTQEQHLNDSGQKFIPDFVLKLPDGKHLILDSKVSLVAYERAVAADDGLAAAQALKAHCQSLRAHIDGLSKKNYSQLIGIKSPDFVLMFVPIEPAYIEALKHDAQLFNYGYERNVILVSYTTLMPILRTVANLWRIERGNKEAQEIAQRAGDIYNQICLIAERLAKLGSTLNSATKQYNQSVTALVGQQGLFGKVEKFRTLSAKAQSREIPQIELLDGSSDTFRLEQIIREEAPKLIEEPQEE